MLLTETHSAIRDVVRAFAQERIRPNSAVYETSGGYPLELFHELAGLGLMGMTAPAGVGGAGAHNVSYALSLMEVAAAAGALATIISIQTQLLLSGLPKGHR